MDIPPEMLTAKAALGETLPFVPGVVGIDIGLREEGLELTDELVIHLRGGRRKSAFRVARANR